MIPTCTVKTKKEWRTWLRKNHKKESKVFLISYKKHTGVPSISHKEAMEEAICFGWIDTTLKRLDDERYQRCFVKRTEKGRWSKNTLSYAEKMIKHRKMTKLGMVMYQAGLRNTIISHDLPKNPEIPQDLLSALTGKAKENFANFAPSYRKFYIYWIERAKRPETRMKRIKEVARRAKKNKKPNE
jgi:uncharacterized protein YdeI (YjbR/CyaY-like superfamily)